MASQRDATISTTEPRSSPSGDVLPSGTTVGRYVLGDRIGAGAMGIVYSAYDASLARNVAVKLVRAEADGSERARRRSERLLREARVAASIAHPNVVTVFDVGMFRDQVFVAMEWLGGGTLRDWLASRPRNLREICARFAEAAAGLAAAHAAGLVHRDFKPDNVLIGDDNRARVGDFGLAVLDRQDAGEICGTPAYMAPEQLRGEDVGSAADQYSFCAVLFEALYGRRPHTGTTIAERLEHVERDADPAVPLARGKATVPAELRAIMRRGLARAPAARGDGMAELARALNRASRPARRRSATAVGVAAAAVAAATWLGLARDHAPTPCAGAGDEIGAVWNAFRRGEVSQALLAGGQSFAPDAWNTVQRELDAYAARWAVARHDTCEATFVQRTQSGSLFDLQTQCLSRRRAELAALVDVLGRGGADVVERAPQAAARLGRIDDCRAADLTSGESAHPPVASDADREEFDRLHARAAATTSLGLQQAALDAAKAARALAERSGDRRLVAQALADESIDREDAEDDAGAISVMSDAYRASEVVGADRLRADCAIKLMEWTATRQHDGAQSDRWRQLADAILERIGDDPELAEAVAKSAAVSLQALGHHEEAVAQSARTLELAERRGRDDFDLLSALGVRAFVLIDSQVEAAQAQPFAEREIAVATKLVGAAHPSLGIAYNQMAAVLMPEGKFAAAIGYFQKSLAISVEQRGADSERAGDDLSNIGAAYLELGDLGNAEEYTRRALAIFERRLGPAAPQTADSHLVLGQILDHAGRAGDAISELARAVQIYEALPVAQQGSTFFAALGEEGVALVGAGRPRDAVPLLERALAHRDQLVESDEIEFALAQALWGTASSRQRARTLARSARDGFASSPDPRGHDRAAAVDAWLHHHGGS